ncbi:MAG: sulfite reductase (ferredoxin) [Myxococcota bacterium]|jgi:sulfite reductase (ferredoxin)
MATTWRDRLSDQIDPELSEEIRVFETQMALRKQEKLAESIFAETRLRRGVYGQRYDNGQRHDGVETKPLVFPQNDIHKGPDTKWDAPGMMRIKIPMGRVSAAQMECMADLAEEYSDAILHVTTRQDIQLHFVHIEDTPDLMYRLASVGITTREACGNSVRNVTACPIAGVCKDEGFDVTPYANALTYYFLGHRDIQDFGRKVKVSFSGCKQHACGLANFHDLGIVAATRQVDGETVRGFEVYVGGGLGAVPRMAKELMLFCPPEELMPVSQAVFRIFARLGEKANRSRARLKFLVDNLGVEEFRRLVAEERAGIPDDEKWRTWMDDITVMDDKPLKAGAALTTAGSAEFEAWRSTNVQAQRQDGYVVATIRMPLGDYTSGQARVLADMARKYTGDTIRLTVEQNVVFRWVPEADLPAFYEDLKAIGLNEAGAGTISDITACPGTDTCKLGISASRGLAGELEKQLAAKLDTMPDSLKGLRIKTSGCFNSCGQHHVADIGFLGVSRNIAGRRVAHFQLVVGGEWANNGGSYGLAIGAYPSKRIPEVVDRLAAYYTSTAEKGERFKDFMKRVGRKQIKVQLEDLRPVPPYEVDPSFYVDWGDSREYTIGDLGVGECAGEVVSFTEFGLSASELDNFEAQISLDEGEWAAAGAKSFRAMLNAAKSLVQMQFLDVADDPDTIVSEFKTRFHDTKVFHDKYAKGKFAGYLMHRAENPPGADISADEAHRVIEETQLFLEAARTCYDRMQEEAATL